jgi:hypothetical protein
MSGEKSLSGGKVLSCMSQYYFFFISKFLILNFGTIHSLGTNNNNETVFHYYYERIRKSMVSKVKRRFLDLKTSLIITHIQDSYCARPAFHQIYNYESETAIFK